jgi:hypothetical protein
LQQWGIKSLVGDDLGGSDRIPFFEPGNSSVAITFRRDDHKTTLPSYFSATA